MSVFIKEIEYKKNGLGKCFFLCYLISGLNENHIDPISIGFKRSVQIFKKIGRRPKISSDPKV